jgi:hypothetical protein
VSILPPPGAGREYDLAAPAFAEESILAERKQLLPFATAFHE